MIYSIYWYTLTHPLGYPKVRSFLFTLISGTHPDDTVAVAVLCFVAAMTMVTSYVLALSSSRNLFCNLSFISSRSKTSQMASCAFTEGNSHPPQLRRHKTLDYVYTKEFSFSFLEITGR